MLYCVTIFRQIGNSFYYLFLEILVEFIDMANHYNLLAPNRKSEFLVFHYINIYIAHVFKLAPLSCQHWLKLHFPHANIIQNSHFRFDDFNRTSIDAPHNPVIILKITSITLFPLEGTQHEKNM